MASCGATPEGLVQVCQMHAVSALLTVFLAVSATLHARTQCISSRAWIFLQKQLIYLIVQQSAHLQSLRPSGAL